MKILLSLLVTCCTTATVSMAADVLSPVKEAEAERVAVATRASQSVLAVFGPRGEGGGSGVVISPDGYALSNFHVTQACGNAMKCGMADGELYDAVIVGIDPTGDVALLKLLGRDDFPHAPLGDSDQVSVGDWAYVMGNPFLLASDFTPTVTYGIISGTHRYQYPAGTILEYTDCLQTDAAINPGNSGGPLFDSQGRVIGINGRGSFEKRGRVNVGIGYAISINQIKNFLGTLRGGRIADHATLGARVAHDYQGRVVVSDILTHVDAYRRGLRYDDEIVSLAGRTIGSVNEFKNLLGIFPKGWRIPLTYRRDRREQTIHVRLLGLHRAGELEEMVTPQQRQQPDRPSEPPETPEQPQSPEQPEATEVSPVMRGMPEIVREHFASAPGFVNFYFNQVERDRVFSLLRESGAPLMSPGAWEVRGQADERGAFRLLLSDQFAEIELATGMARIDLQGDLMTQLDPPRSGGLLACLGLWRLLHTLPPENWGTLEYAGTAPLPFRSGLWDVLIASRGGAEIRSFVGTEAGTATIDALEFSPELHVDPCEVYLRDYDLIDGLWFPREMEIRVGDEVYDVLRIESVQVLQP